MTLQITIQQPRKKSKIITTNFTPGVIQKESLLTAMRKLWEIEQVLNNLPGADLKVTFEIQ